MPPFQGISPFLQISRCAPTLQLRLLQIPILELNCPLSSVCASSSSTTSGLVVRSSIIAPLFQPVSTSIKNKGRFGFREHRILGHLKRLNDCITSRLWSLSSPAIEHYGDDTPAAFTVKPAGSCCSSPWGWLRPIWAISDSIFS